MKRGLALVGCFFFVAVGLGPAVRANDQAVPFTPVAASLGQEIIWHTFLGGAARDWVFGIVADENRNTYITGLSAGTWGSPVAPYIGGNDVFVAKLDANGSLLWNTFLGGSGDDVGFDIGVDTNGNVFVTGYSKATWGSPLGPHSGLEDGFMAKLDATGSLQWNTFLGGPGYDWAKGLSVDTAGNSTVTGHSSATWGSPAAPFAGGTDGFAAKLDTNGALLWSTFFGGPSNDYGCELAQDTAGNSYIAGYSYAVWGLQDAMVVKLDPNGVLEWTTSLGGSAWDDGLAIAVDTGGNSYVAGRSTATWGSPISPFIGSEDVLVAKLHPNGILQWNTFLGGAGSDVGFGLTLDMNGNCYVTGTSGATWGSPVMPFAGSYDAFVAKLDANGSLRWSTFVGGPGSDSGYDLSLDTNGDCIVTGWCNLTWGSPVSPYVGDYDACVAKIRPPIASEPVITSLLPDGANAGDPALLLTVVGSGFVDGAIVRLDGSDRPTTFISSFEVDATVDASDLAAGRTVQVTVRNPGGEISNALVFSVNNPVPALSSLSTAQVTGGGAAFMLTVQGSNFVPSSVIRWNGSDRTTTYVSSLELQAAIPASDLATCGDAQVAVFNPAPIGGLTSALTLRVSGFAPAADPSSVTVTAGQSATYTLQVTPRYGPFDAPISFACTGLPGKCSAAFLPTSVTPGGSATTTTLTLTTRASANSATASLFGTMGFGPPMLTFFALVLGLLLAWIVNRRLSWQGGRRWLVACALFGLVMLIGSCSSDGGGNNLYTGTPKGTHQISVQATSGTMTVSTMITLVVN